jgi:hypothetical protein
MHKPPSNSTLKTQHQGKFYPRDRGVRVREILGIMKKRATAYTKLSYPVNLLTNNSICN